MDICVSSESIWFRLTFVALAIYFIATSFLFVCRVLRRLRSILLNRKPTPLYKPIPDVSVSNPSRPLLSNDDHQAADEVVSLEENAHVNKDTKVSGMQSVRVFTYESLVDATENFSFVMRICDDGLGDAYIGQMVDTSEAVVIRRLDEHAQKSPELFVDEVLLLSQASHPNLAKLIGYCAEQHNRLLVYEYVRGISLKDRLHGNLICLDWNTRMKIVLGIARALEYLQNTMKPPILHCFIELCNIWLDGECVPKLFSSGVIRMYPSRGDPNCPYDMCRTFAYGLHDYHRTRKLTLQSDVHGFGMFLLEIITGKGGLFSMEDGSEQILILWATPYLEEMRNLDDMVDQRLEGRFDKEGLYVACKLIKACLNEEHSSRPLISDVVKTIECLVECLHEVESLEANMPN